MCCLSLRCYISAVFRRRRVVALRGSCRLLSARCRWSRCHRDRFVKPTWKRKCVVSQESPQLLVGCSVVVCQCFAVHLRDGFVIFFADTDRLPRRYVDRAHKALQSVQPVYMVRMKDVSTGISKVKVYNE